MNIFFLDNNAEKAAAYQCDRHVVKMTLETTQLLCTAHHLRTAGITTLPNQLYKPTHENHPCSLWARFSKANYKWLALHGVWLAKEYQFRYKRKHGCYNMLIWLYQNVPVGITRDEFSEPPRSMPERYKCSDVIMSYRRYYIFNKYWEIDCKYEKGRPIPAWLLGSLQPWNNHLIKEENA